MRQILLSRAMLVSLILSLLYFFNIAQVKAQPVANPVIGGMSVYCQYPDGTAVLTEFMQLPDLGKSWIINGIPLIMLNPMLQQYPPQFQLFTYAHECAHHLRGSILQAEAYGYIDINREKEADCTAAQVVRRQGILGPSDMAILAQYISMSPGLFPFYLPGPQRAQFILACYQGLISV